MQSLNINLQDKFVYVKALKVRYIEILLFGITCMHNSLTLSSSTAFLLHITRHRLTSTYSNYKSTCKLYERNKPLGCNLEELCWYIYIIYINTM